MGREHRAPATARYLARLTHHIAPSERTVSVLARMSSTPRTAIQPEGAADGLGHAASSALAHADHRVGLLRPSTSSAVQPISEP